MKDNGMGIVGGMVALLLLVGGILFIQSGGAQAPVVEKKEAQKSTIALAQCLKDKGAVFYGAFWCPHCKQQKALFGTAVEALPYVECSTPDGNAQNQVCIDKKITGYPTWRFADGTELTGEVPLEKLAEKSGCSL
jgi:thiol-disulfide isomerase/thioredoxin